MALPVPRKGAGGWPVVSPGVKQYEMTIHKMWRVPPTLFTLQKRSLLVVVAVTRAGQWGCTGNYPWLACVCVYACVHMWKKLKFK